MINELLVEKDTFLVKILQKIVHDAFLDTFIGVKIVKTMVKVEHPNKESYGDYSSNLALIIGKQLKMKPMDAAEKIARKINEYIKDGQSISLLADSNSKKSITYTVSDILENVKTDIPGFINLWLNKVYLISQIGSLLENKNADKSAKKYPVGLKNLLKNKKIMVEFTDPNPFKEFHIGHLYSNSVGESLCRLFEDFGAVVKRANYFGDVGMHVAKSVYGMNKKFKKIEKLPLKERMKFLGEAYALGATAYGKDEKAKEEMEKINYLIYQSAQDYMKEKFGWIPQIDYSQYAKSEKEQLDKVKTLFRMGREWSMAYFESVYTRLGSRFDFYYPESIAGEYGMKLVKDSLKKGIFEESEGAVIFRGEKTGLHTRVFVNKLGLPTYEAKELGLAPAKYKDFPYDFSLIVTGKEIKEYFYVLMAVLSQVNPKLAKKTQHLGHGMVRLPQGKMSSRTGEIITGEWLLDTVKDKVLGILKQNESDYSKSEQEKISEKAAVAAVKYSLLKVGLPSDIAFDIDKSVSFEGDSGPYLQYTYARCRSVLRKAQTTKNKKHKTINKEIMKSYEFNAEEMELLRTFYRFDEVVLEAVKNLSPNILCTYLFDLAQKFNLFYQKHSILGSKNKKQKTKNKEYKTENIETVRIFRLALTEATAAIIKKGLYLLGIATVERM